MIKKKKITQENPRCFPLRSFRLEINHLSISEGTDDLSQIAFGAIILTLIYAVLSRANTL